MDLVDKLAAEWVRLTHPEHLDDVEHAAWSWGREHAKMFLAMLDVAHTCRHATPDAVPANKPILDHAKDEDTVDPAEMGSADHRQLRKPKK